jgi:hypothetical protein
VQREGIPGGRNKLSRRRRSGRRPVLDSEEILASQRCLLERIEN